MSLTLNGRHLRCDGAGCGATTPAPVGLRQQLGPSRGGQGPAARGWLFAGAGMVARHFCPGCAGRYLDSALYPTPPLAGRLPAEEPS
jgi:hypothetical protein